jgi:hypothetical protein
MGFFSSWLDNAIRERMPVSLGSDYFRDTLGEMGPAYTDNSRNQIQDPVKGWMHVVSCTTNKPDETPAPCHITYVVQAEGVGLFSGEQVFELWSDRWPSPCDDLPVVFDRTFTDHIRIQWDRLPTHAEYIRQQIHSHSKGIAQFDTSTAPQQSSSTNRGDVISRLERLANLRDTGVISAYDFEIHMDRLLGETRNGRLTST